jgi:hypothetical protein
MVENYIDVHEGRKEVKIGIGHKTYNALAPKEPTISKEIEKLKNIGNIIADAYKISHDEVRVGFCQDLETLVSGYPMALNYQYRYSEGSKKTKTKFYYGPRN